ncbi:hypothetical protein DIS24_g11914 [Lasiodiplodia hormozganensis]|uniref:Uncharacterized protein n=1 Tax=Lasiodiplodia hormozganensis TaxID=869390 RepID=A0AA39WG73_9PEZI|nr:hypothetical protein DIS24_g11914 [Lasiodiplodia hormozganensis]
MDSAMAQQEADFASLFDVYCGVWTNWSRGKVLGATLTLSREDGNLLIAFLAFFVTAVGEEQETLWQPFDAKNAGAASNYAQQCYSPNTTTGSLECSIYIKKRLRTSLIGNASCPFQPGACRSENSSLLLDTGLLDSNDDFGLNAPPGQRFQYRRRLHCAPLATEGLTSKHNISSDRSYTRYHFGPTLFNNFTYEYSNDAIWEAKKLQNNNAVEDYTIGVLVASSSNGTLSPDSDFSPRPSIARDNADVVLFFLSANGIIFIANTTDDWYRATRIAGRVHRGNNTDSTFAVYEQDEAASPLGCVQQEQFCNPSLPEGKRCTPLTGNWDVYDKAAALFGGNDDEENSSANRLWWAFETGFETALLHGVVRKLATRSLVSKFGLSNGVQGPLPDNQWQLEVELWHNTVLAIIQENFVAAARGQSEDPRLDKIFMGPDSPEAESMCRNQKIRSTAYVSFSLLGLILILALGFLIILVAATLEPLAGCVQRRWGKTRGQYARLEWTATETLQLQRLAHEELGFGGAWTGAAETVPVTAPGELLAMLDVRDLEHPRLLLGKKWEGADVCGEAEKVRDQQGGGEVVSGAKQGVDGEAELRVTVQHTQGSSFSGGSEETLGRDESVSPTEVVRREV